MSTDSTSQPTPMVLLSLSAIQEEGVTAMADAIDRARADVERICGVPASLMKTQEPTTTNNWMAIAHMQARRIRMYDQFYELNCKIRRETALNNGPIFDCTMQIKVDDIPPVGELVTLNVSGSSRPFMIVSIEGQRTTWKNRRDPSGFGEMVNSFIMDAPELIYTVRDHPLIHARITF
jgi:hypothetical protein